MSLLDENFDFDLIHNIVLKYLKRTYVYTNIDLKDGYYRFDENGKTMIEYDDNPENWYIMKEFDTSSFYITRWVNSSNRYKYDLHLVKIKKGGGQLNYLINEFIK
jgi:hypothetical protein